MYATECLPVKRSLHSSRSHFCLLRMRVISLRFRFLPKFVWVEWSHRSLEKTNLCLLLFVVVLGNTIISSSLLRWKYRRRTKAQYFFEIDGKVPNLFVIWCCAGVGLRQSASAGLLVQIAQQVISTRRLMVTSDFECMFLCDVCGTFVRFFESFSNVTFIDESHATPSKMALEHQWFVCAGIVMKNFIILFGLEWLVHSISCWSQCPATLSMATFVLNGRFMTGHSMNPQLTDPVIQL